MSTEGKRRPAGWLFWSAAAILLVAVSPLQALPPALNGSETFGLSDPPLPQGTGPSGPSAPYVTVVASGPSANRVDVVFLGDGYTAAQIDTTYAQNVSSTVDYMFGQAQQPFARYRNFYNVHRVNVVSAESGADVPPLGIYRNTALDASYYWDGATDRLLYVNETKAAVALTSALAGSGFTAEMRFVAVNDTRYGGGGASLAVYAAGNSSGQEVALHEMGHSFGGLADEYAYTTQTWTGGEHWAPNITSSPAGTKWRRWLGYVDPDHPEMGPIGAYEGAAYYTSGLYRPSQDSRMRDLGRPFDAVGREQLILSMYHYVRPLDGWLSDAGTLVDPSVLWVDTVDPAVIKVDWYVNGLAAAADAGETFSLQSHGYGPGTYSVRSHAYDGTGWVRLDSALTWEDVNWTVTLTPEPATMSLLVFGGAVLLCRRREGKRPR